ncbi:helix-turn-helix domain-containing protein [Streptomyces rishiriensis]|uniref:helix-turn-helix domain-containing protein n=1 Tax=Streptomyces rishiriensis TaxID=68264 RepID=UPI0037A2EEDC
MKRKVGYTWRLRELMAQHRIFTATELVPLLRERGIDLSASQVHRMVSGTPERLSLQVLSALCDILACTPADLVATTAENAGVRKTGCVGESGERMSATPGIGSPSRGLGMSVRSSSTRQW